MDKLTLLLVLKINAFANKLHDRVVDIATITDSQIPQKVEDAIDLLEDYLLEIADNLQK